MRIFAFDNQDVVLKSALLDLAYKHASMGHPDRSLKSLHCAILILENGKEYIGFNSPKSHPVQARFSKNRESIFKHAEIDAIVKALRNDEDIRNADIFVARAMKNGDIGNSKPCIGCMNAIEHFEIESLTYTTGQK